MATRTSESPMAFEAAPHDSLQPDNIFASPQNGNSRHASNPASPLTRMQSPSGLQSLQNTLLSPTGNSQAVFSETPRSTSDRFPALPGNDATFWFDLLSKFRQHVDNERFLHQQETEGLRNEIRALQAQVQMLRSEPTRCGENTNACNGGSSNKAFYPDDEVVRRSREGLERIRQPSAGADSSRSVSPGKFPPPPPSIASVHGMPSRLASIDEHVAGANRAAATNGVHLNGTSDHAGINLSPLDAQTPHSPPATATGARGNLAQTPAPQIVMSHPNQRQRRSSETQHPETLAAVSRAVKAMGTDSQDNLLDGNVDGEDAGKDLSDDPRLTGQLSLPHNPNGPNSRKSEEFLAAMWSKVKDDAEPAVLRAIGKALLDCQLIPSCN